MMVYIPIVSGLHELHSNETPFRSGGAQVAPYKLLYKSGGAQVAPFSVYVFHFKTRRRTFPAMSGA